MNTQTQPQVETEHRVHLERPVEVDVIDSYLRSKVPSQSCHRSWYDELIVHEIGRTMYDMDCWGEIYFHVKYKRVSPDRSIEKTRDFSISGTKATSQLVEQLRVELSRKR